MLSALSVQQVIEPTQLEAVGGAEQQEAWYKHLSTEVEEYSQLKAYRKHYMQWLKQSMAACTAYVQRACMNLQAKCYLQVYSVLQTRI